MKKLLLLCCLASCNSIPNNNVDRLLSSSVEVQDTIIGCFDNERFIDGNWIIPHYNKENIVLTVTCINNERNFNIETCYFKPIRDNRDFIVGDKNEEFRIRGYKIY